MLSQTGTWRLEHLMSIQKRASFDASPNADSASASTSSAMGPKRDDDRASAARRADKGIVQWCVRLTASGT